MFCSSEVIVRRLFLYSTLFVLVFLSGCFPAYETVYEPRYYDPGYYVPELLLLFSVFTAVPIVMIFLSLVLPVKTNRWLSTVAVVLTTLFVVGGGSATYTYFFFATLEIASMIAVLWYAWRQLGKTEWVRNQFVQTGKNVL